MSRPFESAASELVDEATHPVEQLDVLDAKAKELQASGESDALVECRIKQLALHRVLVYLYDFPLQALIRSQISLAEAYAQGGFAVQARDHLGRAKEATNAGIYDDVQCQRLHSDILLAEGTLCLSENQLDQAHSLLQETARLVREMFGEMDERAARIHGMLGDLALKQSRFADAADHFSAAWEVSECISGVDGEETLRARLKIAEAQHQDEHREEAIDMQRGVVEQLRRLEKLPGLLVESSMQLARWLEQAGRDREALEALQATEHAVHAREGPEDAKAVDVKRDIALLHLKLGDHALALQYLNDVHYFERRLHGSQSTNVARTLKALGMVHMVAQHYEEAEQCFRQALRIFEADHPLNHATIRDINAKLTNVVALARAAP